MGQIDGRSSITNRGIEHRKWPTGAGDRRMVNALDDYDPPSTSAKMATANMKDIRTWFPPICKQTERAAFVQIPVSNSVTVPAVSPVLSRPSIPVEGSSDTTEPLLNKKSHQSSTLPDINAAPMNILTRNPSSEHAAVPTRMIEDDILNSATLAQDAFNHSIVHEIQFGCEGEATEWTYKKDTVGHAAFREEIPPLASD
ncbi:hypothetical protein HDU80_009711, partial [Chytriomyces hyalinus]